MQEETRRLAAAADAIRQKIEQQQRQIAQQQQQQQQQQRSVGHDGGVGANPVLPNDLEDWEVAWQTVVDGKVPVATTNTTQAPSAGARVTASTTSSAVPETRTATNSMPQPPSTTNNNQDKTQSDAQKNRRISSSRSRTVINLQRLNMLKLPKKMVIKPLPTMV